jgi:hypothetical protein
MTDAPNMFRGVHFEHQDCIQCHMVFMVPKGFTRERMRDTRTFWCPNGHQMSYAKSEADRLKDKLLAQEQATATAQKAADLEHRRRREAEDSLQHTERRLAAQKSVTTRLKNRVSKGICPCCNRTFINLQRHMATKHAGFTVEDVQEEVGRNVH